MNYIYVQNPLVMIDIFFSGETLKCNNSAQRYYEWWNIFFFFFFGNRKNSVRHINWLWGVDWKNIDTWAHFSFFGAATIRFFYYCKDFYEVATTSAFYVMGCNKLWAPIMIIWFDINHCHNFVSVLFKASPFADIIKWWFFLSLLFLGWLFFCSHHNGCVVSSLCKRLKLKGMMMALQRNMIKKKYNITNLLCLKNINH